jgi:hypothetical protein
MATVNRNRRSENDPLYLNVLNDKCRQAYRYYRMNEGFGNICNVSFPLSDNERVEVEFSDGTYDAWEWGSNPNHGKVFHDDPNRIDNRCFVWNRVVSKETIEDQVA